MMTPKEIQRYRRLFRDRTRRGEELLDATPSAKGWRKKIDLRYLDMGWALSCVLGYAYGDFYAGLKRVGLAEKGTRKDAIDPCSGYQYGFSLEESASDNHLWSMLTEAWIARLRS